MAESKTPEFDSPQQLADYFTARDATRGMILVKMSEQFGLSEEEADSFLSRAQFKGAAKVRGKGLTQLALGIGITVVVAIISLTVTNMLMRAGYFPGLPLWLVAGAGMLFGVAMAFRGLMKMLSGTDVDDLA